MIQTTTSGVKWVPTACDPYGKVTEIRIFADGLPAWQVAQACLDAERVRIEWLTDSRKS